MTGQLRRFGIAVSVLAWAMVVGSRGIGAQQGCTTCTSPDQCACFYTTSVNAYDQGRGYIGNLYAEDSIPDCFSPTYDQCYNSLVNALHWGWCTQQGCRGEWEACKEFNAVTFDGRARMFWHGELVVDVCEHCAGYPGYCCIDYPSNPPPQCR